MYSIIHEIQKMKLGYPELIFFKENKY